MLARLQSFSIRTRVALTPAVITYKRLFRLQEIEESFVLKSALGAVLFFFFLTFEKWITYSSTTRSAAEAGKAVCWPYFQNCGNLYFLDSFPASYSQSIWYMALYAIMLAAAYAMWRKHWTAAHLLIVPLLAWKLFSVFVLSYTMSGPYDYYHIIFTVIVLFLPYKEYFLKLAVVLLYFLSATVKLHATWVLGTYFTAIQTGLPLFPDALTPLATNLVIFEQIVGAWFLLSRNLLWQRLSLSFLIFFHLYSGIFVYYHYPSVILPLLLILFGPLYRYAPPPTDRKSIPSWVFVLMVMLFQIPGFVIPLPGDRRETLEGNRYGMFMFEANHQCIVTITTVRSDRVVSGTREKPVTESLLSCRGFYCLTEKSQYQDGNNAVMTTRLEAASSWNRCDPHTFWSQYHTQCGRDAGIVRIGMMFDHSINGGPFYRIVDTPNVCDLSYSATSHNTWIAVPPVAPIVGYPVNNFYKF